MFGNSIELFRLFGFSVRIDASWIIIALLVTWTLATGVFPYTYPGFTTGMYWWMGIVGALGLFASIVLHELSHSLVAREYGLEMRGITLFVFGGVAEMAEEPPSPRAEFMMAVAGPLASVAIGVVCYLVAWIFGAALGPAPLVAVLAYLGGINLILAVFNLIPAFPLDGGRVLRSILWGARGDLRWATWITSRIGSWFGALLIVAGVVTLIFGQFITGLWWFLIGLFLRNAAQTSYQQVLVRRALEGEPVARIMQPHVQTVSPRTTLRQFVEDYIYRYHHKMFPVVEGDHVVGCVTTRELRDVPRDEWELHTVQEVAGPCSEQNTIDPSADAAVALAKMSRTGVSRLMVVENGHLRGIVSLKDMMRLIAMRMELDEELGHPA